MVLIAPRLCLALVNKSQPTQELIYSGVGCQLQTLQIDKANGKLKHVSTRTVFKNKKSTINGITQANFETSSILCCHGEKELYLHNKHSQRSQHYQFSDWIIYAKLLEYEQIAILFACNRLCLIQIVNNKEKLVLEQVQTLALSHSAVILSGLISGTSWNTLEVYVGTIFGSVHSFRPAQNGSSVVKSFDGHNGMVFNIKLVDDLLFSTGDDRSLRVWDVNSLAQLAEVYGHEARPQVIEVNARRNTVFTAGDDQVVCIWRWRNDQRKELYLFHTIRLSGAGSIRTLLVIDKFLIVGSMCGQLTSVRLHHQLASIKPSLKQWIQKILAFCHLAPNTYFVIDDAKSLYLINNVNGVSTLLLSDPSLRLSSLVVSPDSSYVSVTSTDYLYLISTKKLVYKAISLKPVPLSTVWFGNYLLVVLIDGTSILYEMNEELCPAVTAEFVLRAKTSIFCALMLQNYLILGTRTGIVLVVEKGEDLENWSLKNIQRVHGGESVTDVCLAPASNTLIWTIGRDGCWRQWKFGNRSLEPISSVHLLEWPCKFVFTCHKSYVAGFASDQFHVLDLETQLSLCNYKCGGGNHQWQLSTGFQFDFLCRGVITCVHLNLFDIQHFYKTPHCDQITVIRSQQGLCEEKLIISGGLDGQLVSHKWSDHKKDRENFETLFSADGHFGSILDIHFLNQQGLLVSVGSRCEIVFWQIDFEVRAFKQIFSKRLLEDAEDCRILRVEHGTNSEDKLFLLMLFSDGSLRCLLVDDNYTCISKCFNLTINCHSMYSTFQLFQNFVFLVSTCGRLHCFSLNLDSIGNSLPNDSKDLYKLVDQIKVEENGLSALAVSCLEESLKEDGVISFVGSESGRITAIKSYEKEFESLGFLCVHASTVTAIQILLRSTKCEVISVGIDCRACLTEYCLTKKKLTLMTVLPLNIADPVSLLCWPKTTNVDANNKILCLVAGSGLESINIGNF